MREAATRESLDAPGVDRPMGAWAAQRDLIGSAVLECHQHGTDVILHISSGPDSKKARSGASRSSK